MTVFGSVTESAQRLLVVGIGVLTMGVLGRSAPDIPDNIDPAVYRRLIEAMRAGGGFYVSIDETFRAHGMGPVDSVLAVRSPLGFQLLALVDRDVIAWLLLLVATTAAAFLLARVLHRPVVAVVVIVFFALVGQVAWTAPELWASVLVVAAVALALDDRWLPAVAVATVATSVRELAVLVLVGLVVSAWRRGRSSTVPLSGLLAAAVYYLVHWSRVMPYLAPAGAGRQADLFGTGSFPGGVVAMTGTWIPGGLAIGPVLFILALAWAGRRGHLPLIAPVLGLVLTGAVVDRPEWATFVVPITLALGLDEILWRIARPPGSGRERAGRAAGSPVPVGSDPTE